MPFRLKNAYQMVFSLFAVFVLFFMLTPWTTSTVQAAPFCTRAASNDHLRGATRRYPDPYRQPL